MNDYEWLATRRGTFLAGGPFAAPDDRGSAGLVVEPTQIPQALRLSLPAIAVVGWPTGRHHSVIKAAEARLAAESGADEIWLALPRSSGAANGPPARNVPRRVASHS